MTPAQASGWSFTDPLTDTCEVKCHQCLEFSPLAEWTEGTVGCEDCGDHDAIFCPACDHGEDHVWSNSDPMEVREPGEPA